jgi:hypothetical protein
MVPIALATPRACRKGVAMVTHAGSPPAALSSSQAATDRFNRAFAELTQSLQQLLTTTAQQQRVNEIYLEYAALLQAALAGHDVQQQGSEAYARYVYALQEALAAAPQQQRMLEAFHRYASAVREGWSQIDAQALDPVTMATIAQSLLTASSTVAAIAARPTSHAPGAAANSSPTA